MLKPIPVDSLFVYFFLAFVAMVGLSYINFLPGVVNALAGGIGFTDAEAGRIVAVNGYGGIVGSTVAIFLVRRIDWRPAILTCMALLAVIDIGTVWVDGYGVMLAWRFLAGVIGGLCVGLAISVLARLNSPDRAFGCLLFVQFSIGSLVIYLLPGIETQFSAYAVFYVMASLVLLACIVLLLLPALPIDNAPAGRAMPWFRLPADTILILMAIIFYQTAASAIWAYVGLIGRSANIASESVSLYIASTGMLGLLGALVPVLSGKRFSRLFWLLSGVALSITAAVLLNFSQLPSFYITAMALLFFSWPAVQSYLLAVTAQIDPSGQLSTIASVAAAMGLASGPLLASSLLNNGDFSAMLYICAVIFLLSLLLFIRPVKAQQKLKSVVFSAQPQS